MKSNIITKITSGISRQILKYLTPLPSKKNLEFTDEYDLVIVCFSHQVEMLKECLKSIYKQFPKIPHIFVFTDLDVDMDACRKSVRWFPAGNLNIIRGSDCLNYHLKHEAKSVIDFAKSNPKGIKLAATLQMLNAGKPIICCEANVLWNGDILPVIKPYLNDQNAQIAMPQQSFPLYDQQLIEKARLQSLENPPYFNSSLLFLKKLSSSNRTVLESLLTIVETGSDQFSEQTIMAYINKENGNSTFDKVVYTPRAEGDPKKSEDAVARVYTGGRVHLFWRDALLS